MRPLIAIFAIAIVAMMAISGVQAALENAGRDFEQNETFTPTTSGVITLDKSNLDNTYYDENVTVLDENGTETTSGIDYRWNANNGTLEVLAGGALDGDASATVIYGYARTTQAQRDFAALVSRVPQAMGIALPAFLVIFLLVFARGS